MPIKFLSPATIERIAEQLRERAGLANFEDGYQVNAEQMARTFDCDVQYVSFDPTGVSARVQRQPARDSGTDYLIEVNASDSEARRRYSIAHEVAHVLLHADDKDFNFTEYRMPLSGYADPDAMYKEVQANMLAAALLMPASRVRDCWKRVDDIDDLAREFNVSRDSAYWRLNNLDLLSND